jgi:hypothetical protein
MCYSECCIHKAISCVMADFCWKLLMGTFCFGSKHCITQFSSFFLYPQGNFLSPGRGCMVLYHGQAWKIEPCRLPFPPSLSFFSPLTILLSSSSPLLPQVHMERTRMCTQKISFADCPMEPACLPEPYIGVEPIGLWPEIEQCICSQNKEMRAYLMLSVHQSAHP